MCNPVEIFALIAKHAYTRSQYIYLSNDCIVNAHQIWLNIILGNTQTVKLHSPNDTDHLTHPSTLRIIIHSYQNDIPHQSIIIKTNRTHTQTIHRSVATEPKVSSLSLYYEMLFCWFFFSSTAIFSVSIRFSCVYIGEGVKLFLREYIIFPGRNTVLVLL